MASASATLAMLATTHTPTITTATPTVITAKGPLMPSPQLRLMLRLTPRLTPGCTTTVWDTLLTPTATAIMASAMLPMLATTHTAIMEDTDAEMATELWF